MYAIPVQWPFSHQSQTPNIEKRSTCAHTRCRCRWLTNGRRSRIRWILQLSMQREICNVIGVADICVIVRFYNNQKQVDHTPNYMCISPRRWTLLSNNFHIIDSSTEIFDCTNTSTTWWQNGQRQRRYEKQWAPIDWVWRKKRRKEMKRDPQ